MSLLLEALEEKARATPSETNRAANHLLNVTLPRSSRRSLLILILFLIAAGSWALILYASQWLPFGHSLQWLPLGAAPQKAPLSSQEATVPTPVAEPPQPFGIAHTAPTPRPEEQAVFSSQQSFSAIAVAEAATFLPNSENPPGISSDQPRPYTPDLAAEHRPLPETKEARRALPVSSSPSSKEKEAAQNPSPLPAAAEQVWETKRRASPVGEPSITKSHAPSESALTDAKQKRPLKQNGPSTRQVTLAQAYQLVRQGRWPEAASAYQALLLVAPDHPDVLLGNALVAVQLGHHAEAVAYLRRLLTHAAPGHPQGLAQLAHLTNGLDPLADESALRLAIARSPQQPELHHALGRILAAQNRWSEAQQAFFHAMTLAPTQPTIRYDLAVSLDQLGQYAAALHHYREAEQLASRHSPSPIPVAQLRQRIQLLQAYTLANQTE